MWAAEDTGPGPGINTDSELQVKSLKPPLAPTGTPCPHHQNSHDLLRLFTKETISLDCHVLRFST